MNIVINVISLQKQPSRGFFLQCPYSIKSKLATALTGSIYTEGPLRLCSVKKVFLEISQNSQKNTFVRASLLTKLQAWGLQLYFKKNKKSCFPVNFVKFLRTPFFKEHLWWLLLSLAICCLIFSVPHVTFKGIKTNKKIEM